MSDDLTDAIHAMFAEQDARREYLLMRDIADARPHGCTWRRLVGEFVLYGLLLVALGFLLRAVA